TNVFTKTPPRWTGCQPPGSRRSTCLVEKRAVMASPCRSVDGVRHQKEVAMTAAVCVLCLREDFAPVVIGNALEALTESRDFLEVTGADRVYLFRVSRPGDA